MAKQFFLCVFEQRAGYVDGSVEIGIYRAENEEEAKKLMAKARNSSRIYDRKQRDEYAEKDMEHITASPLNGPPIKILTHHSTYSDY